MEEREDGCLAIGADINHELLASILVEEPLTSPSPSSLFEELTSSLMDPSDIDLYLECDDDKSYAVPKQQDDIPLHSLFGNNVNMRISFPTPPSDASTDEGFSCRYCKCNFLSQKHLSLHTKAAHGLSSIQNDKIKRSFDVDQNCIDPEQDTIKKLLPTPGAAAALVPSLFSSNGKKAKLHPLNRKTMKKKNTRLIFPSKNSSKSDSELVQKEESHSSSEDGKLKSEVQNESTNETIDVEYNSSDSSPTSHKNILDISLKKHAIGMPFTCDICMKTYVSKYALKRHVATHSDERPFICSFPGCKGAFKLKSRLTDHVRYVHKRKTARTGNRSKSLPVSASTSVIYHNQLPQTVHQRVQQTPIKQTSIGAPNIDSSGTKSADIGTNAGHGILGTKSSLAGKIFKCSMPNCSREFRDSHNLRTHMCLHTGHLPLKCSHCDFRCIQKASLDWHVKKMHVS